MTRGGEWFGEEVCRILRGMYIAEGDVSLLLLIVRMMILYGDVFCLLFGDSGGDEFESSLIIGCDRHGPK